MYKNMSESINIIQDVGEKIGGARKDLYGPVLITDLYSMTPLELENLSQKSKIWRGNDFKNVKKENDNAFWLLMLKIIKDSIPVKPLIVNPYNSSKHLKEFSDKLVQESNVIYAETISKIRDIAIDKETFKNNSTKVLMDLFKNTEDTQMLKSIEVSNFTKLLLNYIENDELKENIIKNGTACSLLIPRMGEYSKVNKNIISFLSNYGYLINHTLKKMQMFLRKNEFEYNGEIFNHKDEDLEQFFTQMLYFTQKNPKWHENFNEFLDQYLDKNPQIKDKVNIVCSNLLTKNMARSVKEDFEEIEEKKLSIEEASDKERNEIKKQLKQIEAIHLSQIKRKGYDWRDNKNVEAEDFMNEFGFRGVEFGNALPNKERQIVLNMAYDSFCDLAYVLKIKRKELGLLFKQEEKFKSLAMAFGTRGVANTSAIFSSVKNIINLNRLNGAGSLAHEFGHALEFAINNQKGNIENSESRKYNEEDFREMKEIFNELKYKEVNNDTITDYLIYDNIKRNDKDVTSYNKIICKYISSFLNFKVNSIEMQKRIKKFNKKIDEVLEKQIDLFFQKDKECFKNITIEMFRVGGADDIISKFLKFIETNQIPFNKRVMFGKNIITNECEKIVLELFPEMKKMTKGNQLRFINNFNILSSRRLKVKLFTENKNRGYVVPYDDLWKSKLKIESDFYSNAKILDSFRVAPYFTLDTELGARAFERIIQYKLNNEGCQNDYLIVEGKGNKDYIEYSYYNSDYEVNKISTLPSIEETKCFEKLYDKLIEKHFTYDFVHKNQQDIKEQIEYIKNKTTKKEENKEINEENQTIVEIVEDKKVQNDRKNQEKTLKEEIEQEENKIKNYKKGEQMTLF